MRGLTFVFYSTAVQCGCDCSDSSCVALYRAAFLPSSQGKGNFCQNNSEQTSMRSFFALSIWREIS